MGATKYDAVTVTQMIVAVAGGKGGVGKTTVSLNLGAALEGVVVDGDLAAPDLPHEQGPGIHDVLAGTADPLEAVQTVGSVRVLSGGQELEGARAANLDRLETVVGRLERMCGTVIVDCPAGLARDIGLYLDTADLVVLVTTPDPLARGDVTRTKELAVELGTPISCVVINTVTRYLEATDACQAAIESALGVGTVVVPFDSMVGEAQEEGQPIVDIDPESAAASRFEQVATVVTRGKQRTSL